MIERYPKERRKAPRVPVDLPLEFIHPFPREVVRVKNISSSGICCISTFPLPEMSRVGIILKLPALSTADTPPQDVKCEGAVVRCMPSTHPEEREMYELAIFLTEVSPSSRKALHAFVNACLLSKK